MENYRIRKIDAHTWQLEDPFRTYLYLIEGTGGGLSSSMREMVSAV